MRMGMHCNLHIQCSICKHASPENQTEHFCKRCNISGVKKNVADSEYNSLKVHQVLHTPNSSWNLIQEDDSCVCDQCPGEDEHVQNEVHALLICQDHRVCELRKHFSFLFSPFFEDFSAAQPFLLQQVNNRLVHDFLSQQNNRLFLFLSELMDLFVAGRDQSAADQPTIWLKVTPHCNHCNHCMWPMSWWRWTCSERGGRSLILPRPSSLWAEETLFLSVFTFFWGLFSSPTLFAATGQQPTCL